MSDKKERARINQARYRAKKKEEINARKRSDYSEKRIISHPKDTFTGTVVMEFPILSWTETMAAYSSNMDTNRITYKHLILYGDEQYRTVNKEHFILAGCFCGPRRSEPTHMHVLIGVNPTTKFELNFKIEGRKDSYRSIDIRCVRHYIAVLHYLSCARSSVSNKFKKQEHYHTKCRSPFPWHVLGSCADMLKEVKRDDLHSKDCVCMSFWQPTATLENKKRRRKFIEEGIIMPDVNENEWVIATDFPSVNDDDNVMPIREQW